MLPKDVEYRAIRKCYDRFCAQLHYPSIGPKLVTSSVVTMDANEAVRAQQGSRAQNEKFLNILAKNGSKDGFYKFLDILKRQATFVDLVELLELSLEEAKAEIREEQEAVQAQGSGEGHASQHRPSTGPADVDHSSPMELLDRPTPCQTDNRITSSSATATATAAAAAAGGQTAAAQKDPGGLQMSHFITIIVAVGLAVLVGQWLSRGQAQPTNPEIIPDLYYSTTDSPPPLPTLDMPPSMKHLRLHVIPHVATDWESLADILLNSPNSASVAGQISANIPTVANRCAELLKVWLKMDPHANWTTLLAAVDSLGHKTLAKTLRVKIERQEL